MQSIKNVKVFNLTRSIVLTGTICLLIFTRSGYDNQHTKLSLKVPILENFKTEVSKESFDTTLENRSKDKKWQPGLTISRLGSVHF